MFSFEIGYKYTYLNKYIYIYKRAQSKLPNLKINVEILTISIG